MAKSQLKKKRTRQPSYREIEKLLNEEQNKIAEDIEKTASETSNQEPRATQNAYVFVLGCKTSIRTLPDQNLVDTDEQLTIQLFEVRSQLQKLENLSYNINRELNFRGLKQNGY